jgi:hypothetical protein
MKNQYFGDINDYRKYGLLRALAGNGDLKVGVCWMLTPDDGSTDGRFRKYLGNEGKWRPFDSDLFICLSSCKSKDVVEAERLKILAKTKFWCEPLPDQIEPRQQYFRKMRAHFETCDLIFFDPDNGFEVRSRPYGRKHSSKYLFWHEFKEHYEAGFSLLVYQHFCREERESFIKTIAVRINRETAANPVYSFWTSRVVFFLAPQSKHIKQFERRQAALEKWDDEIQLKCHQF